MRRYCQKRLGVQLQLDYDSEIQKAIDLGRDAMNNLLEVNN